jgi:hypothetical protein
VSDIGQAATLAGMARTLSARLAASGPAGVGPDRSTVATVLAAFLDGATVVEEFGVRWHATRDQGEWIDFGFLDEAQARSEIDGDGVLLCRRTVILPVEEVAP